MTKKKRRWSAFLRNSWIVFAPFMGLSPDTAFASDSYRAITAEELYKGIMDGQLAAWVQDPAERSVLSTSMATSYMIGVGDATRGKAWCPDKDFTIQRLSESVLDYLADLPKGRYSEDAAVIVSESLARVRPCRQQQVTRADVG